ncbi:hypothetical protein VCRA2119O147_260009 [Vibrio crassostreae]|nr:hypothetical protein VCRA2119O147_260009 [Vibrio crassostreae]CAK2970410.1 hypothetical protein VCRA2110O183_510005 [Vibrio crassostreae]CAK3004832.1 hypothetical protein VCRA2121O264_490006 [Vibrio crassostreae]CAK3713818.1 hypothetical protein VCRA2121O262_510006 [Vibrio crassostreae]
MFIEHYVTTTQIEESNDGTFVQEDSDDFIHNFGNWFCSYRISF